MDKPVDPDYDYYLYGKRVEVDPWGWWTINKNLETQSKKYDPNRLLKPMPERDLKWDHTKMRESTDEELGEMLTYFGAQAAFIGSELGMLRGALAGVGGSIEIAVGKALAVLEREAEKKRRPLKDGMIAEVIYDSPLLAAGKHEEIELEARVKVADGYYTAMDRLWTSASREITRREQEYGRRHQ